MIYNLKHISLMLLALVVAFVLNIFLAGSSVLSISEISFDNYIFANIRLTKALTAVLCGISLPVAGQILQVLFRNPLAGPYVLGISSSSSFFVAIVVMFMGSVGFASNLVVSKSMIVLAAFIGSLLSTVVILLVAKKITSNVFLLLVGLMLGQIFGALQSFIEYFSSDKSLRDFIMWGFGSLGNCSYNDILIYAVICLALVFVLFVFNKPFQVFLLGQNYTNALGVNYKFYRFLFILISSVLTGLATAYCGPIAFIGLSVPIMSRLLFGVSNQKFQLISCLLLGATIMLLCDIFSHVILPEQIIPINIITTLFGSPFIIYLLFKNKTW